MSVSDVIRRILGRPAITVGALDRKLSGHEPRVAHPRPRQKAVPEPIEILPEYGKVEELLAAGAPLIFVTGGAGTGKSTFIRHLTSRRPGDLVVLAPTGVAALNAGGMTIHSFCGFPPAIVQDADVKPAADRRLVSRMKLLVIDEVSMLRPDLLDAVDLFFRRSLEKDDPFGGIPVVLVGDLFQLPPVTKPEEGSLLRDMGYASNWYFSARCLRDTPQANVFLTRVFRQKDPEFISLLARMRIGADAEGVVSVLNHRFSAPDEGALLELTLTARNNQADYKNRVALAQIPGPERLYRGNIEGDFGSGQARLPSPIDLRLKVGAQVMFTKNDDAKRFVNGTIGRVVALSDTGASVEIDADDQRMEVEVLPVTWDRYRYSYDPRTDQVERKVIARYRQLPLMLAWAVTIHKAQGKTLARATVDLGHGAFAPGQAYVAVSRMRSIKDLRLAAKLNQEDVRCDPLVKKFYEEIGGIEIG